MVPPGLIYSRCQFHALLQFILHAVAEAVHHVEAHQVLPGHYTNHLIMVVDYGQMSQPHGAKDEVSALEGEPFWDHQRRVVDIVALQTVNGKI